MDLLALVLGTLYDFVYLLEALLHAYFLKVPSFLAVCALGMCSWACSITVMFVSASETTTEFKFKLWFVAGRAAVLRVVTWVGVLGIVCFP